jgi:hypothetical protein
VKRELNVAFPLPLLAIVPEIGHESSVLSWVTRGSIAGIARYSVTFAINFFAYLFTRQNSFRFGHTAVLRRILCCSSGAGK